MNFSCGQETPEAGYSPERSVCHTRDVKTIGVIGARRAGCEIACAASLAGYHTVLEDLSPQLLEEGLSCIRGTFEGAVARGTMQRVQTVEALAALSTAGSVEDTCRIADFLIEAGPEELEFKLEIFTLFDRFALPGAILASNTSSLSITDLAGITSRQENCVGFLFSSPVGKSKRVRITRGLQTSDATISTCRELARRMGKDVEILSESIHT